MQPNPCPELTEVQIRRAMFIMENEARKKRVQLLQEILDKEKSHYEYAKLRLRQFCSWLMYIS